MGRLFGCGLMLCLAVAWPQPTTAQAQFVTGNQLYAWCSTPESRPAYYQDNASCVSYILGVVDGAESVSAVVSSATNLERPIHALCVPPRVIAGQLQEIVLNYIRAHPEGRHENASLQVMIAITETYPCPNT